MNPRAPMVLPVLVLLLVAALVAYRLTQGIATGPGDANGIASDGDAAAQRRAANPGGSPPTLAERLERCERDPVDAARPSETLAERARRRQQSIADALMASGDAEHLLFAALLDEVISPARRLDLVSRALQLAPDNRLVSYHVLHHCAAFSEAAMCQADGIDAHATLVDGGNALVWIQIAARRHARGDDDGALEAMRQANTAPGYDDYWFENIRLVQRAMQAAANPDFAPRPDDAIDNAFRLGYGHRTIVDTCRETAAMSEPWWESCRDFGERMERDGRTVLDTAVGLSLQKAMLELSDDVDAILEVDARQAAFQGEFGNLMSDDADALLAADPQVLADYLNVGEAHGEMAAARFVEAEVARLSALPDYNPCP